MDPTVDYDLVDDQIVVYLGRSFCGPLACVQPPLEPALPRSTDRKWYGDDHVPPGEFDKHALGKIR